MDDIFQLLREHFDLHPDMQVQDAVKFLYQSHLGGGHLIADEADCLARLRTEWTLVKGNPSAPLTTPLGNNLYRLHLNQCKAIGLSSHTVNRLFCLTAQGMQPNPQQFAQSLEELGKLPFPREMVAVFLAEYRAQGCPMLSHSHTYRQAYSPAYRIVSAQYVKLLPLLAAIDRRMERYEQVQMGIDGPCASGKSTLGQLLSTIYQAPLVAMDDFFLRPEQRTPQRLAKPGGNVDYERFADEVLTPLQRGEQASYRPWQCRQSAFGPEVVLPPSPLTIVEGSYSLHPALRSGYHLRVWLQAPWPTRLQRLREREGRGSVDDFLQRWIPLEEEYFSTCQVKQCCHVVLTSP